MHFAALTPGILLPCEDPCDLWIAKFVALAETSGHPHIGLKFNTEIAAELRELGQPVPGIIARLAMDELDPHSNSGISRLWRERPIH